MLTFRPLDSERDSDFEHLRRWGSDPEIRHLFMRFRDEADYQRELKMDLVRSRMRQSLRSGRILHLIELAGEVVGEVSLIMDSVNLIDAEPSTAWLGIVLGEEHARGRGLGRIAMEHIEDVARQHGAVAAQIGVFEYNKRALGLYGSMGYRIISTIPDYTWWNGRRWSNIRMDKPL